MFFEISAKKRWFIVVAVFAAIPLIALLGYVVTLLGHVDDNGVYHDAGTTIHNWGVFFLWVGGIDIAISTLIAAILALFFSDEPEMEPVPDNEP